MPWYSMIPICCCCCFAVQNFTLQLFQSVQVYNLRLLSTGEANIQLYLSRFAVFGLLTHCGTSASITETWTAFLQAGYKTYLRIIYLRILEWSTGIGSLDSNSSVLHSCLRLCFMTNSSIWYGAGSCWSCKPRTEHYIMHTDQAH